MSLIDPFLLRALLAGIGVALVAGVMGCFVIWQKMAYFGDSLSHSALLGIALGVLLGVDVSLGAILVCSLFSVLLVLLQQRRILATDTLLGILAHASLSIGMVTLSLLHERVNLHAYLFGDILTVTWPELFWIYGGGFFLLCVLLMRWPSLVLMSIHEDMAQAEGVNTFQIRLLFMFLMTLVVAVSIRIVGILLITSMLVIPSATARQFSSSPESMALKAVIFAILSVFLGAGISFVFDTPSGPSIVSMSALMFALVLPLSRVRK